MLNPPKTVEEAKKYRYGRWAGNPGGAEYRPKRCLMEVWPAERGLMHHQCFRSPGHGPGKLYCRQHAEKVEGKNDLQER